MSNQLDFIDGAWHFAREIADDSFVETDDSSAATDEHQLQHMSIYA
ncbi:hypothetical protein H5410_005013 [Solanum commersonii]|uniref:Uncharacterized protein n=1 Tax=Solanum commersonii TaxID=4109 RepID=A0A9J6A686_SOLCO|nr:hypothetical protein H5410_005013 [Solanum commersonii]